MVCFLSQIYPLHCKIQYIIIFDEKNLDGAISIWQSSPPSWTNVIWDMISNEKIWSSVYQYNSLSNGELEKKEYSTKFMFWLKWLEQSSPDPGKGVGSGGKHTIKYIFLGFG